MSKILVVEDESKIARFVQLELMHEGYEVEIARDGLNGLEKLLTGTFNLAVLDVMMPGINGFEVCKRAREKGIDIPIIMLTAKDDISDKVEGLNLGADDYMTKPFAIEELLARIKVALTRHIKIEESIAKKESEAKENNVMTIGKLVLNRSMHTVHYGEDDINLTKKEFELLEYLMENVDVAIGRDTLLNKVWGYEYYGNTNVVDVYIRYIRQKLDDKYGEHIINTVRGIGYMIRSGNE